MQFFSEISKLRNKCYAVFSRFHFFPMHERIVCLATLGGIINEWVHEEWMISSSFCRSVGQVQVRSGQVSKFLRWRPERNLAVRERNQRNATRTRNDVEVNETGKELRLLSIFQSPTKPIFLLFD